MVRKDHQEEILCIHWPFPYVFSSLIIKCAPLPLYSFLFISLLLSLSVMASLPTTTLPPPKLCNCLPRSFIFLSWLFLCNFQSIFQACGWQSPFLFPLLVLFIYRVLLCSSGWLRAHYKDQAGLEFGGILLPLQNIRESALCWLEHRLVPTTSDFRIELY